MAQEQQENRQDLITSSKIMSAAGFDPQTGCSEAFRYVVGKVEALVEGDNLKAVSANMALDLYKAHRIGLPRPVDPAKIEAVLQAHFN